MTTENIITTYLCNKSMSAIEIEPVEEFAIKIDEPDEDNPGLITTALSNGTSRRGTITLRLFQEGVGFECEVYQNLVIHYPEELFQFPAIEYNLPTGCNWIAAVVSLFGFEQCTPVGCFYAETIPGGGGLIHLPDDTDKSLLLDTEPVRLEVTDNDIAPGQKVVLDYYFDIDGITITQRTGRNWYDVPWITSGIVTGITGDPKKNPDCQVKVWGFFDETGDEEMLIDCRRTDWVEWAVGDWVYILRDSKAICPMKFGIYQDS